MTFDDFSAVYRYEPDTGLVFKRFKHVAEQVVGCRCSTTGYLQIIFKGKIYLLHRVAWLLSTGSWPSGYIDHVNGVRDDNRVINLRDVSRSENQQNAKMNSKNTSGVVGVRWRNRYGRWEAQITANGRKIYLGRFDDLASASAARKVAEREHGFHPNHGRSA